MAIKPIDASMHSIICMSPPVCPQDWKIQFSELIDENFDMGNTVLDVLLVAVLHVFDNENVVSLIISDFPVGLNAEKVICNWIFISATSN